MGFGWIVIMWCLWLDSVYRPLKFTNVSSYLQVLCDQFNFKIDFKFRDTYRWHMMDVFDY